MGNLRDKYTDEEWDALVEESKKIIFEPKKYHLTKEELLEFVDFIKLYGSYSRREEVLDDYLSKKF